MQEFCKQNLFNSKNKSKLQYCCIYTVQDIQEQYLVLEESLRQLSNIIRLERKQLSDELEAASTTGHSTSDRSFQQQLLQLSDKQKTLLKCFESQKRLGSQLKVLISKQNHYSTRSKMLLKQTHSQENKSSGCYRNTKQLGTKEAKVTPFKPIQPVESSIKLPSHSQLTSAVVGQLKRAAFNSNVTLSDEQHRLPTKNQQSQNLVTISQVCVATQYTSVNDQQPVGVATQYTSVNDQQPVGMAERNQPEKSQVAVSVVPSQISSVSVAPQQKRMNIGQQPVGVATQHNQLPVGVVKQVAAKETPKQTVEMTAQQSVDIIQCQVPVLSHQQKSVGVIVQQQSLDVPMLSLRMTPQHATVGVASQQPAGRDTQKQPINAAKSVGVATQQAADITTQQQPINAAKSVGVATQQAADIATQQQPINAAKSVGVATQQAADIATQQQPINAAKSVGVATQQAADITTQKQPINAAKSVGVATQQPAGRATQQQPINAAKSVGVATQQQPINAAKSVGVATQQQPINAARKLVGIAKNSQSKEVDTHQSLGGATQLVNKVQPISTQQATGVATKQPMKLLLHSELSQPVPLDVLIQHQLITSQDRCLTCTLMVAHVPLICNIIGHTQGCQFIGSLASNGNIISQDGRHFSNPAQWLNNCWSTLGHNKRVDRRSAYSKVSIIIVSSMEIFE